MSAASIAAASWAPLQATLLLALSAGASAQPLADAPPPPESPADDAMQWADQQQVEPWMRRYDVVDPAGWIISAHGVFHFAATDDLFGVTRAGEVTAPGLSLGGGGEVQLGYRFGWVGLDVDLAYAYLTVDGGQLARPAPLEAHSVFGGLGARLWIYTFGAITLSVGLGGGLSGWFAPFLVDETGIPERVSGLWSPYVLGAFRFALPGFSVDLSARTVLGPELGGGSLFPAPSVVLGVGLGFWVHESSFFSVTDLTVPR